MQNEIIKANLCITIYLTGKNMKAGNQGTVEN